MKKQEAKKEKLVGKPSGRGRGTMGQNKKMRILPQHYQAVDQSDLSQYSTRESSNGDVTLEMAPENY